MDEIDWESRWKLLVETANLASHSDTGYWDRRAPSYARTTHGRLDLLKVLEPYLSPRKTLIDVGAGTGRHTVPLAARLEWVTAVEPSEGMRSHIPALDNITVIASTWEDAEVAPADLVICSHVMYGVADPVPFLAKLDRSARERVFVMMRESPFPHPAARLKERLHGDAGPRMPRFSELFMLLRQMGIAPDVQFISYPFETRYASMDEALADSRAFVGDGWDEPAARAILEAMLRRDGDELVYDGGVSTSGVAHWQPQAS